MEKKMIIAFLLVATVCFSYCASEPKKQESIKVIASSAIPENRQKMAEIHDRMANCLRGDQSMESCHEEMMKSCKEAMGKDGCMMGQKMHKGHKGKK